ncbi:MAG: hypothetical protein OXD29_08515 [Roseovarius sp.]|nr:hypothetical protein [Roseovarius sp.]
MTCPGLPADWVNAWLGAVGITVLDSRLKLHWSRDATPVAVISFRDGDPVDALGSAWPSGAMLDDLPVAEHWRSGRAEHGVRLQRKVPVEALRMRMREARGHPYSWTLTSTMTDLCVDKAGEAEHAPFDPAGPGSTKWLHHRLTRAHTHVDSPLDWISSCLEGCGRRVEDNGLGFDQTRIGSQSDKVGKWTDPVVEVLAFFGLALLPAYGEGVDRRMSPSASLTVQQKGWLKPAGSERHFLWPAWEQPLDRHGIDALLDAWNPEKRQTWHRYGIHAAWKSVQFKKTSDADATRAYGAERL